MVKISSLELKLFKNEEKIFYLNEKSKTLLSKNKNKIENCELNTIKKNERVYEKLNRQKYNKTYNSKWVYEYYKINTNVLKNICTEWDGWDDIIYETGGIIIDKSNKNKIIIYYYEKYMTAFSFIYTCLYPYYGFEELNDYCLEVDLKDVEDFIDLIEILKKKKEIEIFLNSDTYETMKNIKLTLD